MIVDFIVLLLQLPYEAEVLNQTDLRYFSCGLITNCLAVALAIRSGQDISFEVSQQWHSRPRMQLSKVLFTDSYTWHNFGLQLLGLVNRLYTVFHKTQKS